MQKSSTNDAAKELISSPKILANALSKAALDEL